MEKTETFAKSPSLTHFFAIRFIICAFCDASEVLQRSKVWKSTALFTLFGFWMQTNLAGFAGCQECRKARRSRMVLDNLRKLLNHHAAKKRKLGSLKKCKQRDLFQHLRQPESRAERFQAAFVSDGYFCGWFSSHCHCCFRVAPTARCFSSAVASPDVIFWKSRLTAGACRLPLMRMGSGVRSPAP